MTESITVMHEDGISTLCFNRPEKRNAINGLMIGEFTHQLQMFAQDQRTRIVLIRANGEHFCAGADIVWMKKIAADTHENNYADAYKLADLLYQLYYFPKPIIVLTQGATLGGGIGFISASDIVIAADNAIFGFPEVKMGLIAATISPYVMHAIGERLARYYFLTGEQFDANEARRIHLIHRITSEQTLLDTGLSVARLLLENGPQALMATKRLIHEVTQEKITQTLTKNTAKELADIRQSVEAREGFTAFLEKRKPSWNK